MITINKKENMTPLELILIDIEKELYRANRIHSESFNSLHEAYAVLKEEVDELWHEIKCKKYSKALIRDEAIQVAAMAVKLVLSCCSEDTVD